MAKFGSVLRFVPEKALQRLSVMRLLMLFAVWGTAVFLWSSFSAWTHHQFLERERQQAQPYVKALNSWLLERTTKLGTLAKDPRLAEGIVLPSGAESLPIQRVLYEYAYINRTPDVYAVDLLRGRVGKTAGASPLPENFVETLADSRGEPPYLAAAFGMNNGQILVLQAATAPLPQQLFVGLPVSLVSLEANLPSKPAALESRKTFLILPHPQGLAQWPMEGTRFTLAPEDVRPDMHTPAHLTGLGTLAVFIPLPDWPNVFLAVALPDVFASVAILPQLLVLLWALAMSALILLHDATLRKQVMQRVAPFTSTVLDKAPDLSGLSGSAQRYMTALQNSAPLQKVQTLLAPFVPPRFLVGSAQVAPAPSAEAAATPADTPAPNLETPAEAPAEAHAPIETAPHEHSRRRRQRGSQIMQAESDGEMGDDSSDASLDMMLNPEAPDDDEDIVEVVLDCLSKKRIQLLYQPIYNAADGSLAMHEVFSRLKRKDGRAIPPQTFLPILVDKRLVLELDLLVLRRAVHDNFKNGEEPSTPLALNISSTSLDGIAYLQEMASQGPRILRNISFEVSSQEMIRDPKSLRLLKEIQRHGCNLAVDYFGGGNAMLDASKSIGFNYVKLDSLRYRDSIEDKKQLIRLCQYARNIQLPIILEKVDSQDIEEFGRKAGASLMQGYYLCKPQFELSRDPLRHTATAPAQPDTTDEPAESGE